MHQNKIPNRTAKPRNINIRKSSFVSRLHNGCILMCTCWVVETGTQLIQECLRHESFEATLDIQRSSRNRDRPLVMAPGYYRKPQGGLQLNSFFMGWCYEMLCLWMHHIPGVPINLTVTSNTYGPGPSQDQKRKDDRSSQNDRPRAEVKGQQACIFTKEIRWFHTYISRIPGLL